MVLESLIDGQRLTAEVAADPAPTPSPTRGKPALKWTIRAGDTLKATARPAARAVELFSGTATQSVLVCRVIVNYFQNRDGAWVPHFRLEEEPLVTRQGKRWVPLSTIRGVPTLIVLTSSTLPNPEGFFPSLEFGLTTGLLSIDLWIVR